MEGFVSCSFEFSSASRPLLIPHVKSRSTNMWLQFEGISIHAFGSSRPGSLLLLAVLPAAMMGQATLFRNGRIITEDSLRSSASWFVVENGLFGRVGGPEETPPPVTNTVDLQGRTVMPGFIDAHIHFVDAALSSGRFDLGLVHDTADLRTRIEELILTSADEFVVGRNLHPDVLKGLASPRSWLDRQTPGKAVILVQKSGHAAVANSVALNRLGYGGNAHNDNGTLGHDPHGELDGRLYEAAAMKALEEAGNRLTDRTLVPSILEEQHMALVRGITTIGDNTFAPYHLRIYQALQRSGDLKLRVRARSFGRIPTTHDLMNGMGLRKMGFLGPRNDFDRVSYHAIKLFEDMSLSRPADMHDHAEPGGRIFYSEPELRESFLLHPRATFAFHVQGKTGVENILDAWEQASRKVPHHRHVLDHAGYIHPDQVRRAEDLGLSITVLAPQVYDMDRLLRDYKNSDPPLITSDLLDAREKVRNAHGALTSDLPYGMDTTFSEHPSVDAFNPFGNMAGLVEGTYPNGATIPGIAGKTLTIDEALLAYTVNGAHVLGEGSRVGRIAEGLWADFIILDKDPHEVPAGALKDVIVLATYIAGEGVYERGVTDTTFHTASLERIHPYDYSVSPVFGYDPTVGFVAGGAFFRYPLRVPGHYADVQTMFSMQGQYSAQVNYMRYGLGRKLDGKVTLGLTDMVQYYFGEGDDTKSADYIQFFAQRFNIRAALERGLGGPWHADLGLDHRSWTQQEVKDQENVVLRDGPIPNEHSTAFNAGLTWDSRDATSSTHKGSLISAGLTYLPGPLSNVTDGKDLLQLNAEVRSFRYLGSARWVLAGRIRTGWSSGTSTYLFRYALGGAEMLRGYYSNRFRGNDHLDAQAELRFALTGRWTVVGFTDAGSIGDDGLGRLLHSHGGGVRFAIKEQVVLRLDLGYGSDQNGVFFTFGQTF